MNKHLRKLVYSAMFLALAFVLPFLTANNPQLGNMLSLMHLPVLLCGFVCGWPWGLLVGFIAPLLRSFTLGAPPLMPTAVAMAFELATYGLISGLLYKLLPKKLGFYYVDLITAMIVGRLIWGTARYVIGGIQNTEFGLAAFWAGAVANAIPGIAVQIVLIPPLIMVFQKNKLMLNE
ncbi:MAG TPA: ECF transporter S component [Oscillospiraceae bacterium]|nr:ECF transporter S component [Oscillospiraceae bacterium]HPF55204.1 ECF transporter S component [Clostridiales bacterium]HPK36412.1 ECF transporter S component [Oscillospiraceae bacterium]HPR75716.1 ECF transporter S component [Oscillospiraceae bacterium]